MKLFKVAIVGVNIATVNFEETPARQEQKDSLHIDALTDDFKSASASPFLWALPCLSCQGKSECCDWMLFVNRQDFALSRLQAALPGATDWWVADFRSIICQPSASRQTGEPSGQRWNNWEVLTSPIVNRGTPIGILSNLKQNPLEIQGKQVASIWLWELLRESWGVTGLKGRFRTEEMIVVKDVFAMDDYIHKSLMTINQFITSNDERM